MSQEIETTTATARKSRTPGSLLMFQESIGLLCISSELLAHGQIVVHQDPKALFYKAAFQTLSLKPVLVLAVLFVPPCIPPDSEP